MKILLVTTFLFLAGCLQPIYTVDEDEIAYTHKIRHSNSAFIRARAICGMQNKGIKFKSRTCKDATRFYRDCTSVFVCENRKN